MVPTILVPTILAPIQLVPRWASLKEEKEGNWYPAVEFYIHTTVNPWSHFSEVL
jgi:hypothetical protein